MTTMDRSTSAQHASSGATTGAPALWRLVDHGLGPCSASGRLVAIGGGRALPYCPECGVEVVWDETTFGEAFPSRSDR